VIKKITDAEYAVMIAQLDAITGSVHVKPYGLFYLLDKNEGKKIYIGIDNTHGDMWVEEFKSLATCKRWLVDTHRTN